MFEEYIFHADVYAAYVKKTVAAVSSIKSCFCFY